MENGDENMKKAQLIINIITAIIIIIILILGYKIVVNNKYSQKYIKELVEINTNTSNYIIEKCFIENESERVEKITQKEDCRKEKYTDTGKVVIYANNLEINESRKTYTETKIQSVDKDGNITEEPYTTKEIIQMHPLKNEFNSYAYINSSNEYKYLGKEKFNYKQCIKCKFILYGESNYIIVWIDEETGFILKEEEYKEGQLNKTVIYNTSINIVDDKDIVIPKLDDYTYYIKE